jgi:hypothetical protein
MTTVEEDLKAHEALCPRHFSVCMYYENGPKIPFL